MFSITGALYRNTPQLTVNDNRGLVIRNVHYHRHPDTLTQTDERITRHDYTARGVLVQSTDPPVRFCALTVWMLAPHSRLAMLRGVPYLMFQLRGFAVPSAMRAMVSLAACLK